MRRSAELAERLEVRLHNAPCRDVERNRLLRGDLRRAPTELAAQLGWLSDRTWLAHAVWTDAAEIERLAQNWNRRRPLPTSTSPLYPSLLASQPAGTDMRK